MKRRKVKAYVLPSGYDCPACHTRLVGLDVTYEDNGKSRHIRALVCPKCDRVR